MNDCESVRLLLVPYLDGEATGEEKARLLSHVGTCRSCAGQLEAHKKIGAMMAALCSPTELDRSDVPGLGVPGYNVSGYNVSDSAFCEQVRARARLQDNRQDRNVRLALWCLRAAAIVLLAVGFFSWLGKPERGLRLGMLKPADELISNLDILEELDEAGIELTRDLVKLLAENPREQGESKVDARSGDPLDSSLFDYFLEEELAPEKS